MKMEIDVVSVKWNHIDVQHFKKKLKLLIKLWLKIAKKFKTFDI